MTRKTILIVEDDTKSKYALESVLRDWGHNVLSYFDAEDAQKTTETIDVAIIDVRLPGRQGPEFAALLKQRQPRIRIIFVTAYDGIPQIRDAHPSSVVLLKPIDMEVLGKLL